jgi:hypothetical protein
MYLSERGGICEKYQMQPFIAPFAADAIAISAAHRPSSLCINASELE